jgi:outer membrane protein OmpA-like peptidoglycan-associated protein
VRRLQLIAITMSLATACGSSPSTEPASGSGSGAGTSGQEQAGQEQGSGTTAAGDEFQLRSSDTAGQAHGESPSEIEATATHAAMRLFVVDPEAGPLPGIVIKMTGPDGTAYYTGQTDAVGYAEVLVPVGQRYALEYLALGRRTATAQVEVPAGPNQDIRLTLRHRQRRRPAPEAATPSDAEPERLVLEGILFDSGRATLQAESNARLDRVVEYMTHMTSARIRISGHTDNVGNAQRNQALSQSRAEAVRDYLVSHGIDGSRVESVGYGDQRPVATNDTEEGRAQNRRIEAEEL